MSNRATRAILAVAAVAAAVVSSATPAAAAAPTGRYVALGDSYTSGPLIPTQVDLNCTRSNHNYPSIVRANIGSTAFVDVSCGGATTGDILNPGSGELGIGVPAQIAAVTADTALVTVGIGGNDIGFSGIIGDCTSLAFGNPFGSPCKAKYTAGGVDQLAARISATAPKIAAVLAAVHAHAPGARVVLVGYPDIMPNTGVGCFPVVPIAWGDTGYLRSVEKSLNAMLQSVAGANNAQYVDTYTGTIGHDYCKSGSTRWIEGLIPGSSAAPFHPNASGEAAMGAIVTAAISA
jgi:lysophospholipase L1-like esterase